MEKKNVNTVKIYFIDPIEIISVVISTLIELEFESFTLESDQAEKLLKIITDNIRNVIFFCIRSKHDVETWLEYIEKIKSIKETHILMGAFGYDNMDEKTKNKFLEKNVSVINFKEIKKDPVNVLKKILFIFEAKGRRAHIRVNTIGENIAYFYMRGKDEPITGKIVEISVSAFACKLDLLYKEYFDKGSLINEVVLVLRGMRIKSTVKVIGFSQESPDLFIFKFCQTKFTNDQMSVLPKCSPQNSRKIHEYIQKCLRIELQEKLKSMDDAEKNKKDAQAE